MNLIGMIVGATLAIYLLASLLEWALFKRIVDSPELGKGLSVGCAVVMAIILYGFGNANGGPWDPLPGGIAYVVGGAIAFSVMLWQHNRREEALEEQAAMPDTFE